MAYYHDDILAAERVPYFRLKLAFVSVCSIAWVAGLVWAAQVARGV